MKGRISKNDIKTIKNSEGNWCPLTRILRSKQMMTSWIVCPTYHKITLIIFLLHSRMKKSKRQHLAHILSSPQVQTEFLPILFHKNWRTVNKEVRDSVHSFLSSGYLLKEHNRTYTTLIPKVDRLQEVKDFKPISLCKTFYKIISKTLVN